MAHAKVLRVASNERPTDGPRFARYEAGTVHPLICAMRYPVASGVHLFRDTEARHAAPDKIKERQETECYT